MNNPIPTLSDLRAMETTCNNPESRDSKLERKLIALDHMIAVLNVRWRELDQDQHQIAADEQDTMELAGIDAVNDQITTAKFSLRAAIGTLQGIRNPGEAFKALRSRSLNEALEEKF